MVIVMVTMMMVMMMMMMMMMVKDDIDSFPDGRVEEIGNCRQRQLGKLH